MGDEKKLLIAENENSDQNSNETPNYITRPVEKIEKSIANNNSSIQVVEKRQGNISANTTTLDALLKRAFLFLEDGEFDRANIYLENVLDQDPENAMAYVGKLMVDFRVNVQDELRNIKTSFEDNRNFVKAIRFADDNLKKILWGYIVYINTRNKNAQLEEIYNKAIKTMSTANTEIEYKCAARLFEELRNYKDAKELLKKCLDQAEVARKDAILSSAKAKTKEDNVLSCESAIRMLEAIRGWRDADEQINACQKKIEEIKFKEEAERLEREEVARKKVEKRAKRKKMFAIVATSILCIAIAFVVFNTMIIPNIRYNEAIILMSEGKYQEALSAFESLNGYKDSDKKTEEILDAKYNEALEFMDNGSYEKAINAFQALNKYKDSEQKALSCKYAIVQKYLLDNDCLGAYQACINLDVLPKDVPLEAYKAMGEGRYKDALSLGATDIIIQKGATHIEEGAFWECTTLESVTIPDSVMSIGARAFYGCRSLTNIIIPESVKRIDDNAFLGCTRLSSISIPNSVKRIGDYMFFNCQSLTNIMIPEGVTSIGEYSFYNCTKLSNITIPDSVTRIGDSAFNECDNLKITFNGTRSQWNNVYSANGYERFTLQCTEN